MSWQQVMPFLPLFLKGLGVGKNVLFWSGLVFAAHPIAGIIAQPFWGKMGDSRGRKPMILRAGVCLVLIYYAMSICRTPLQLVILRFLNGALTGFIPGSFTLIATNTPENESPKYVATAEALAAAGVIVGPLVGGVLATFFDYRGVMRVSGTAVLLSTLLVWWLVQEPNKASIKDKTSLLEDFMIAVRSPILLSLMFAAMLGSVFGGAVAPILALFLKEMGGEHLSKAGIGIIFSLPAAAFVLSSRKWSAYGGRKSYTSTMAIAILGGAIGSIALSLSFNIWIFSVMYFLIGMVLAGLSPSIGAVICTRIHDSFRGRAYGMQQSAAMLGAFVSPLIGAQIGKLGFRMVFVFTGTIFFIGYFIFKRLLGRWKMNMTEVDLPG